MRASPRTSVMMALVVLLPLPAGARQLCGREVLPFEDMVATLEAELGVEVARKTPGWKKLQRGYLPRPTYSAHWIAEPGFKSAVSRFLEQEREAVTQDIEHQTELGPFRHVDK